MGKTYGVYVSDDLDQLLSQEVLRRKIAGNKKATISKLMGACVIKQSLQGLTEVTIQC